MEPLSPKGTIETMAGDVITFTASVIGPAPNYFTWTYQVGDEGDKKTVAQSDYTLAGTVAYWTATITSEGLKVDCSAVYAYEELGAKNTLKGTASIGTEANRATVTGTAGSKLLW